MRETKVEMRIAAVLSIILVIGAIAAGVITERNRATKAAEALREDVTRYTRALEANPADATAYFNRATAHRRLEAYEDAIKNFTAAIELSPDNPEYYRYRGLTYALMGNQEQCASDFSAVAEMGKAPEPAPAERVEKEPVQMLSVGYTVLVSSFRSEARAQAQLKSVEELDLGETAALTYVRIDGESWYRVTVGRFDSREEAKPLLNRIARLPDVTPTVIPATN